MEYDLSDDLFSKTIPDIKNIENQKFESKKLIQDQKEIKIKCGKYTQSGIWLIMTCKVSAIGYDSYCMSHKSGIVHNLNHKKVFQSVTSQTIEEVFVMTLTTIQCLFGKHNLYSHTDI